MGRKRKYRGTQEVLTMKKLRSSKENLLTESKFGRKDSDKAVGSNEQTVNVKKQAYPMEKQKFVWVKFRDVGVFWPVEVVSQTPEKIEVFIKSDQLLLNVKRDDKKIRSFFENFDHLRAQGIEQLTKKRLTETLCCFQNEISWVMETLEYAEKQRISDSENQQECKLDTQSKQECQLNSENQQNQLDSENQQSQFDSKNQQDLSGSENHQSQFVYENQQDLSDSEDHQCQFVNENQQDLSDSEEHQSQFVNENQQDLSGSEDHQSQFVNENQQDLSGSEDHQSQFINENQQDLSDREDHQSQFVYENQQSQLDSETQQGQLVYENQGLSDSENHQGQLVYENQQSQLDNENQQGYLDSGNQKGLSDCEIQQKVHLDSEYKYQQGQLDSGNFKESLLDRENQVRGQLDSENQPTEQFGSEKVGQTKSNSKDGKQLSDNDNDRLISDRESDHFADDYESYQSSSDYDESNLDNTYQPTSDEDTSDSEYENNSALNMPILGSSKMDKRKEIVEDSVSEGELSDEFPTLPALTFTAVKLKSPVATTSIEDESSDDELREEEILRDSNNPDIFIRRVLKSAITKSGKLKKNDRVFNSYQYCGACNVKTFNLAQHLSRHDKDNHPHKEYSAIMAIKAEKNEKVRKRLLKSLRGKFNHEFNMKTIEKGKGEIFLERRPASDIFNIEDYGPCPRCLFWIAKKLLKNMRRHVSIKMKMHTLQ